MIYEQTQSLFLLTWPIIKSTVAQLLRFSHKDVMFTVAAGIKLVVLQLPLILKEALPLVRRQRA